QVKSETRIDEQGFAIEGIDCDQPDDPQQERADAQGAQQHAPAAMRRPEERSRFDDPAERIPVALKLERNGDSQEADAERQIQRPEKRFAVPFADLQSAGEHEKEYR